jgi:hypothetical protein
VGLHKTALAETPLITGTTFMQGVSNGQSRTLDVPSGKKNVAPYLGVKATVTNTGTSYCRVEAHFGPTWVAMTGAVHLEPGESKDLTIHFTRHTSDLGNVEELFPGMFGVPGGTVIHWADFDLATEDKSMRFAVYTESSASVEIANIRVYGEHRSPQEMAASADFYPFVDVYGQYKHEDWPGKVHNDADFATALQAEELDLNNHPAPANRNQFGGWATGPKFEATGHFRVEKIDGKWWFIDPSGCLFWSFSATGFDFEFAETLTKGREHFFEDLPQNWDPLYGQFVSLNDPRFGGSTYKFGPSNLYRKFGSNWRSESGDLSLRRIKSWGMNSMGCWSDSSLFNDPDNPVPYTLFLGWGLPMVSVNASGTRLEFPNPFASGFSNTVYSRINGARALLNSEWCIGYFFQNEYKFRRNEADNRYRVTEAYIQSNDSSDAKEAIMGFLQDRYATIGALNASWGTSYSNWEAVRSLSQFPSGGNADARAWEEHYAVELYRTIKEQGDRVSPKLFLGTRFIRHTPSHMMNAAAPYIDVIGINWYQYSPNDILVTTLDKPIIIGEFHFGAVERGYFDPGLKAVGNQQDRAEAMYYYFRDALLHERIVGAHWFQYRSQAMTGRKDGESYQIGLVDVADNPYPETRAAARELGRELYRFRGRAFLPPDTDNDGIPDSIEADHSLNSNDPSDATGDKDRDGKSNLDEYVLGTDISVVDAHIKPKLAASGGQVEIEIPSEFLTEGRQYHIEAAADFSSGWNRIGSHVPPTASSGPHLLQDTFEGKRLYRVRVEMVD